MEEERTVWSREVHKVPKQNRKLDKLTDDQLLAMRLCDLGVSLSGTHVEKCIAQVHDELKARKIRFRPHYWLSDEWFSPDGIPGVAVPFYLTHPRLKKLERKQLLDVEGGSTEECLRILRHEIGHAIDSAYRIRRRRKFRDLFGSITQPYSETYQPQPFSRDFVLHLDHWYAQVHPIEDFAETFAVWLRPRSRWRSRYKGWPVIEKLQYVDDVMKEIGDRKQTVSSKARVDSLPRLRKTLGEHYQSRRDHYGFDLPDFYDRDLRRLFSDQPEHSKNLSASAFLNRKRIELRRSVGQWTDGNQYTIDQVLSEMISRSRELKLRLCDSEDETKQNTAILLTVQITNYLHEGHHRIAI